MFGGAGDRHLHDRPLSFQYFNGEQITAFDMQQLGQVVGEDDALFGQINDIEFGIEQAQQAAAGLNAVYRGAVKTVFKLQFCRYHAKPFHMFHAL